MIILFIIVIIVWSYVGTYFMEKTIDTSFPESSYRWVYAILYGPAYWVLVTSEFIVDKIFQEEEDDND